jgi:hypothetical protein
MFKNYNYFLDADVRDFINNHYTTRFIVLIVEEKNTSIKFSDCFIPVSNLLMPKVRKFYSTLLKIKLNRF